MLAFFSRIFLLVLAIILIVVGLILLPLPIPFGLITIILGVSILISSNDTAAGMGSKFAAEKSSAQRPSECARPPSACPAQPNYTSYHALKAG